MDGLAAVINGVEWTLTGLSALFLGGRLYVKIMHNRVVWWDDYLLLASWILLATGVSLITYATTTGLGAPLPEASEPHRHHHITLLNLLITITLPFTLLASALSKTSFAMTILRIITGALRRLLWALVVILNLMIGFNIILPFASCDPPRKTWNLRVEGICWDEAATIKYQIATAAFSAGADLILVLLPFTVIRKMALGRQEKLGVAAATVLGLLATSTGVVRSISIPLALDFTTTDYTVEAGKLSIWTVAEISSTIMASSIPSLRVFGRRMMLTATATTSSSSPLNSPREYETYRPFSHIRKSTSDGLFKRTLKRALSRKEPNNTESKVRATSGPHNSWSWVLRGGGESQTALLPSQPPRAKLHVTNASINRSSATSGTTTRSSRSSKHQSGAKKNLVVVNKTSTDDTPPTPWPEPSDMPPWVKSRGAEITGTPRQMKRVTA